MADANKYTILIQSKLDPKTLASIKTEIAEIGRIDLKIRDFIFDSNALRQKVENALKDIKITFGDVKFGDSPTSTTRPMPTTITGSTSSGFPIKDSGNAPHVANATRSWSELVQRVHEATNGVHANISATIDMNNQIVRAVASYTDMEGRVKQLNFALDESGKLALDTTKYAENNANIYKRQANEIERLVAAQDKLGIRLSGSDPSTEGSIKAQGIFDGSNVMLTEYNAILQQGNLLTSQQEASLRKMVAAIKDADRELGTYNRNLASHEKTIERQTNLLDRLVLAQNKLTQNIGKSTPGLPGTEKAQQVATPSNKMIAEYNKMLEDNVSLTKEQERNIRLMIDSVKSADKDLSQYNRTLDSQNEFLKRQLTLHESISAEMGKRSLTDSGVASTKAAADAGIAEVTSALEKNKAGIVLDQSDIDRLDDLGRSARNAKKEVDPLGKATLTFSDHVKIAMEKVQAWAIAMTAFYGAIRQVRQGIEFIKDYDKTLTEIGVVTGQSVSELGEMARGFNQTAKELGSTTQAVAQGSLEFIRQGKTVAETNELIRVSTMQAMLANMSAAQSTEYLTSIMNGFQLEASDMMGVLDKLINLDNLWATSVSEIAVAMQRSSNSARISGVSLDLLASMITVVSSTTRQSAESIGESFGI